MNTISVKAGLSYEIPVNFFFWVTRVLFQLFKYVQCKLTLSLWILVLNFQMTNWKSLQDVKFGQ